MRSEKKTPRLVTDHLIPVTDHQSPASSDELTLDSLRRFDLAIAQPRQGYRFSLDALLLADFVACADDARLADLGTGCGVIPLLLCRRFGSATAVGFESNGSMARLAAENARRNGLEQRAAFVERDILELRRHYPVSSFDGVTANPPFRTPQSGRISPRAGRDTARHESSAGLSDFLATAKYLVKPGGRIWFVHLPERLAEFIHVAAGLNLSLLRLRMVHPDQGSPARIFLAELAKGRKGTTMVLPPLLVRRQDGAYTAEAGRILGETP
ncbi:tRNA1(Val) (adenine(37)-N6)-methyltransferase [Pelobacter propionicus]|uniref:Methyltransferase small n=1 Tax=Pelobacter propionicus (strain DSM 2379 / NBRC 103807 / OttBd1) TaxID=338966 RepID=A1ANW3_PELPD|nr:methyltransferase [Pelobacter propionicus]ABK99033.1 methyltransferase small [Pelobacter propionicus DSM 2379]